MTIASDASTAPARTLYVIACAAPPTLHIRSALTQAQERGWDICLILTPTAARWLDPELQDLEKLTGHPVRSAYKLPGEPDVLPSPDALLVAPASSNTTNKWALGISDNLVLGLITEGIGKGLPIVALPYLNQAQAAHPAFSHSVSTLKNAGVNVLLGADGWEPHGPGGNKPEQFPWHLGLDALASAVTEAIQRQPAGTRPRQVKDAVIARRGKEAKNIAKVAAARELLCDVFYAMRDGRVRRASRPGQAA